MEKEGADFAAVLKEAQDKGYAERNPEADVEGYDACRKIAILSSLMFSKNVDPRRFPTEGITKITAADFEYANATDHTIKLLGRSRAIDDNTAEVMVAPFYFPKNIACHGTWCIQCCICHRQHAGRFHVLRTGRR